MPPGFERRRKQGFSIPLNHWLKNRTIQGIILGRTYVKRLLL